MRAMHRNAFFPVVASAVFSVVVVVLVLAAGEVFAAQAKVGPRDGMMVESLPALDTPQMLAVEKMADTSFPKMLEKMGDAPSALLAWQQVANELHGAEREAALYDVLRLQAKLGYREGVEGTLGVLKDEYPRSARAAEALYYASQVEEAPQKGKTLAVLAGMYLSSPWAQTALMEDVWRQARQGGRVENGYNLPQAKKLEERLEALRQEIKTRRTAAMLFGLVPGGGHAYLGNYMAGAVTLLAWALFALAFLSACRHRHYAYAFVFVWPFAALWVCSPGAAAAVAGQSGQKRVAAMLEGWKDLLPPPAPRPGEGQMEPGMAGGAVTAQEGAKVPEAKKPAAAATGAIKGAIRAEVLPSLSKVSGTVAVSPVAGALLPGKVSAVVPVVVSGVVPGVVKPGAGRVVASGGQGVSHTAP